MKNYEINLNYVKNKIDFLSCFISIDGTTDAKTDWTLGQPEVQVQVDHERAAFYGVSVQDQNML